MEIFKKFGVEPIINAAGTETRFGGARMDRDTLEAMNAAAFQSVCMDELQAVASKIIAEKTHAEAGIVTNGASAAFTLGTAACICGFDVAKMNRLPDTTGIPNEVIMPWHQISGYSHAISAAGAKILGVGIPNDTTPPDEVHIISRWDVAAAITENTVAIAYAVREGSHPPLGEVVEIGKAHNIPIIIDAAAQVPPVDNLHRYIDMGADLVCISGGKGIRGPQGSGILCGRKNLIASAALQMLDLAGEPFDKWDPPESLIPKEKLRGKPEHGIGRGFKVSKEAIIGLLVALQNFTTEKIEAQVSYMRNLLESIGDRITDISGVKTRIQGDEMGGFPVLEIDIDEREGGRNAVEVAQRLKDNAIHVRETYVEKGRLVINPVNLSEESTALVGDRLREALGK